MNKQVLIVDDAPEIHALVKALLAEEPVEVHSATNPEYGLTLAASLRPDLILLDVDMPGMDGYEFCRRLKADTTLWAVPVVFVTAKANTDQKVHGLNLGAVDYITKPFNPGELLARVRGALRTQSVITCLQDRSLIDVLTGFGNRKMFDVRLRAEVSQRARSLRPLVCTYIDVDGFKAINKFYGEPFGDLVLRKVADIIAEVYRPEDLCCRLQHDDFAILMPDTITEAAVQLAHNLKERLSRASLIYRDAIIPVTCGIGIAEACDLYDHSVLDRAMEALEPERAHKSDSLCIMESSNPATAQCAA